MKQSERKYQHLSSKHQIFKENNNNYKKTLNKTKGYKGIKSQSSIKGIQNLRKINTIQI